MVHLRNNQYSTSPSHTFICPVVRHGHEGSFWKWSYSWIFNSIFYFCFLNSLTKIDEMFSMADKANMILISYCALQNAVRQDGIRPAKLVFCVLQGMDILVQKIVTVLPSHIWQDFHKFLSCFFKNLWTRTYWNCLNIKSFSFKNKMKPLINFSSVAYKSKSNLPKSFTQCCKLCKNTISFYKGWLYNIEIWDWSSLCIEIF